MLYLFDSNCFITLKRSYYPMGVNHFKEFWNINLVNLSRDGHIKIPKIMLEEEMIRKGGEPDDLSVWCRKHKKILIIDEDNHDQYKGDVIEQGYKINNPTKSFFDENFYDIILISYAMRDKENRCVVTFEKDKIATGPRNKRIPQVCKALGIKCLRPPEVLLDQFEVFK